MPAPRISGCSRTELLKPGCLSPRLAAAAEHFAGVEKKLVDLEIFSCEDLAFGFEDVEAVLFLGDAMDVFYQAQEVADAAVLRAMQRESETARRQAGWHDWGSSRPPALALVWEPHFGARVNGTSEGVYFMRNPWWQT